MRTLTLAIASGLLATACGSATPSDPGAAGPPSGSETLTITTTYDFSDGMYIEGALAQIAVFDDDGQVATKTKWPGKVFTFPHLDPGTYDLKAALRPCDANCGYLDGPTDRCHATLRVDRDLRVRVDFMVGEPCSIARLALQ
jgi:hypothetical protein